MERQAAVSILYDTLDVLAKIKIDLCTSDPARLAASRGMLAQEIGEAIANIDAAIMSLKENVVRTGDGDMLEPSAHVNAPG